MRLDRKLIHPAILSAYQTYQTDHQVGPRQTWAQIAGCALGFGLGLFLLRIGASVLLAVLPALAVVAAFWIGFSGGRSNLTEDIAVTKLSEAFDELSVEKTWRAYVDTLVALEAVGYDTQAEETIHALNALLDEEAHLHEARIKLAGIQRNGNAENLDYERQAIIKRLESMTDTAAREALAQSLSLIDERLSGRQRYKEYSERLTAHLILIRQTIFATRDAAQRLQALPFGTATDSLRSIVSQARTQSQATEQALAELNAT